MAMQMVVGTAMQMVVGMVIATGMVGATAMAVAATVMMVMAGQTVGAVAAPAVLFARTYTGGRACRSIPLHVCGRVHVCMYARACMHACMHACLYACMHDGWLSAQRLQTWC